MALDTLVNVKARLGIAGSGDDTLLNLLRDSADRFVQNSCNRDFEGGTFTEYFPGNTGFAFLRNYPVVGVTSVKVDAGRIFGPESVWPADRYLVHADRGVIQSLAGDFLPRPRTGLVNSGVSTWTREPGVVQVVYATATEAVPADVKEAYARLVGHWYRRVKTDSARNFQNLEQQRFGDTTATYAAGAGEPPEEVRVLLAPYRVPPM